MLRALGPRNIPTPVRARPAGFTPPKRWVIVNASNPLAGQFLRGDPNAIFRTLDKRARFAWAIGWLQPDNDSGNHRQCFQGPEAERRSTERVKRCGVFMEAASLTSSLFRAQSLRPALAAAPRGGFCHLLPASSGKPGQLGIYSTGACGWLGKKGRTIDKTKEATHPPSAETLCEIRARVPFFPLIDWTLETFSGQNRMMRPVRCLGGNRREFLRAAARYGLLSLLVGLAVGNTWNRKRACINPGPCRQCPIFPECSLPPAGAVRAHREGE
jgi:hypothetical protein